MVFPLTIVFEYIEQDASMMGGRLFVNLSVGSRTSFEKKNRNFHCDNINPSKMSRTFDFSKLIEISEHSHFLPYDGYLASPFSEELRIEKVCSFFYQKFETRTDISSLSVYCGEYIQFFASVFF